jgi:hypothetical protein
VPRVPRLDRDRIGAPCGLGPRVEAVGDGPMYVERGRRSVGASFRGGIVSENRGVAPQGGPWRSSPVRRIRQNLAGSVFIDFGISCRCPCGERSPGGNEMGVCKGRGLVGRAIGQIPSTGGLVRRTRWTRNLGRRRDRASQDAGGADLRGCGRLALGEKSRVPARDRRHERKVVASARTDRRSPPTGLSA